MTVARYSVSTGLAGCYMPDSVGGPLIACTRRELADSIRYEIEFQDFPKSSFKQAKIRQLWQFIKRNGSSVAHFSIQHNGREIGFHGLTTDEAEQMESDND